MLNINTASAQELYNVLQGIINLDPNLAAQLAVNIVDLRDNDVNVTVLPKGPGTYYYGFEAQPFISEIAFNISGTDPTKPANNYFAIELYNPFEVPIPLVGFRLDLRRQSGSVANTVNLAGYLISANSRFVITNNGEPNLVLAKYTQTVFPPAEVDYAAERYDIYLLRRVSDKYIYLDKQETKSEWFKWSTIKDVGQFYYRHDGNWNVVYQNLDPNLIGTLGNPNGGAGKTNYNIPTFAGGFVTVGDIARVLTVGPSPDPNDMIGVRLAPQYPEDRVRINLATSDAVVVQKIFNYLTVFDPAVYTWNNPNETRVKGRVNINTAPWFVIAQLPWVSQKRNQATNYALANAIVAYRDKASIPGVDYSSRSGQPGFKSIGELMNVNKVPIGGDLNYSIYYYGLDVIDQPTFPDLTPGNGQMVQRMTLRSEMLFSHG